MKSQSILFWVLVALAVVSLVGGLLWYLSGGGASAIFGGPISLILAGYAKEVREKEIQAIKDLSSKTQQAGQQALSDADAALQKMDEITEPLPSEGSAKDSGVFSSSTPESLTQQGNDLFKGGSF